MSTPTESHSYFTDAENVAEMARLNRQSSMLTKEIGLLPSRLSLPAAPTILDLACGPGEWILSLSQELPDAQITGTDISKIMIEYAQIRAEEIGLTNAHFSSQDSLQFPWPFPDASFDLINGRFLVGFMRTSDWPRLWQECKRLLRPGGFLCHTDLEDFGLSTSSSLTRYNSLAVQAARLSGQCFTEEGDFIGATAVQHRLFSEAGLENIHQQAHSINFSAGAPAYESVFEDRATIMKMFEPYIAGQGVAELAELEVLFEHALEEMRSPSFCGVTYYQTTWGQKPL